MRASAFANPGSFTGSKARALKFAAYSARKIPPIAIGTAKSTSPRVDSLRDEIRVRRASSSQQCVRPPPRSPPDAGVCQSRLMSRDNSSAYGSAKCSTIMKALTH